MSDREIVNGRILLVEDEALIALTEKKVLERHGYEVVTTHSGEQAVRTATEDKEIELVLMDIDLGEGIDGTEAARQILATRALPIVFLTSHAEKEYVSRVKNISNYGYVLKGSGEFVLIESIHMALQLFEAHKETARKEERLSFIVNEAPVGIFRSSSNGTFRYMNREMAHILGFDSPNEALSYYTDIARQMYVSEEHRTELFTRIESEGVVRDFRLEIVRATGARAWIKISAHSVPDSGAPETTMNGFAIDETERHWADQELERSRQQYRSMVDLAQEIIVRHDTEGRWTFVNEAACRFFGQSREELIGQHYMDYLHPDDRTDAKAALNTMVERHERIDKVVNRSWTPSGYRTVEWNSSPFTDEYGRFAGHQAIGRDITDSRRAQANPQE
ncbi:MAG: PAS domain S-box protein [bacterium]